MTTINHHAPVQHHHSQLSSYSAITLDKLGFPETNFPTFMEQVLTSRMPFLPAAEPTASKQQRKTSFVLD